MKDRSNLTRNPFDERRSDVLRVASAHYRARIEGIDVEPDLSTVQPLITGDERRDLSREGARAAELTVAARTAARFAEYIDRVESGGLDGALARIELLGANILERTTYAAATVEGGIVDTLRGVDVSRATQN